LLPRRRLAGHDTLRVGTVHTAVAIVIDLVAAILTCRSATHPAVRVFAIDEAVTVVVQAVHAGLLHEWGRFAERAARARSGVATAGRALLVGPAAIGHLPTEASEAAGGAGALAVDYALHAALDALVADPALTVRVAHTLHTTPGEGVADTEGAVTVVCALVTAVQGEARRGEQAHAKPPATKTEQEQDAERERRLTDARSADTRAAAIAKCRGRVDASVSAGVGGAGGIRGSGCVGVG